MLSQDKYRIAVLSAYALALHGFESLIPMPIPWLRVGLANIISLTTLIIFGFRAALMVTLIRVFLASIFTGSFLGPGFILSLSGGISSTMAAGLISLILPKLFGPVGLSLIGALFHNLAQIFVAYFLFIGKIEPLIIIAPFFVLIGTITGFVNGLVSDLLVNKLKNNSITVQNNKI